MGGRLKTIGWNVDKECVRLIDQTLLPEQIVYIYADTLDKMYHAIKILQVRGAPAIGIAAAYGLYLGVRDFSDDADVNTFINH
ncbi:MAG: hypothetical protein LBB56_01855, partial [Chitinispirillales bacterium]|nr:hypothetical protein [Chitinispirillales bacterium]